MGEYLLLLSTTYWGPARCVAIDVLLPTGAVGSLRASRGAVCELVGAPTTRRDVAALRGRLSTPFSFWMRCGHADVPGNFGGGVAVGDDVWVLPGRAFEAFEFGVWEVLTNGVTGVSQVVVYVDHGTGVDELYIGSGGCGEDFYIVGAGCAGVVESVGDSLMGQVGHSLAPFRCL